MIAIHRVWAYLLRHLYQIRATIDRKADVVLYPTIDLLIFGLLTTYIEKFDVKVGIGGAVIGGIILWTMVDRIQRDINFSILEDAWSRNLFNLFATPLQVSEVILGILILSILKAITTIIILLAIAQSVFHFNLLSIGGVIAFYILNMFMFGWAFGFFTSYIIFRYGTKVQAAAWSMILLIYPISGVFYPLSVLPGFLAFIAKFLPISYAFEGLRSIIVQKQVPSGEGLAIMFSLNLLYLTAGVWLFYRGFKSAKNRGWFIHPT